MKKIIVEDVFEISTINNHALYLRSPILDKQFKVTTPKWDTNQKIVLPMLTNEDGETFFDVGDYIRIKIDLIEKSIVEKFLKEKE